MTDRPLSLRQVPVIDVAPLVTRVDDRSRVADEIRRACRYSGFFYIVGDYILAKVSKVFPLLRQRTS